MVLRLKDDDPVPPCPYPLPWEDAEGVLCDCELGSKKSLDFFVLY